MFYLKKYFDEVNNCVTTIYIIKSEWSFNVAKSYKNIFAKEGNIFVIKTKSTMFYVVWWAASIRLLMCFILSEMIVLDTPLWGFSVKCKFISNSIKRNNK